MSINLIDIIVILIFARLFYKAYYGSFFDEVFKLLSVYCATVIACHYYVRFAHFISQKILLSEFRPDIIGFGVLALFFTFLFPLIKEGWKQLIDVDSKFEVHKFFLFTLAGIRAYLICGLIFLAVLITNNSFLLDQAQKAGSQIVFRDASAKVYDAAYGGVIKQIFSSEVRNEDVFIITSEKQDEKEEAR